MNPVSRFLIKNIDSLLAAIAAFFLIQLLAHHSGIGVSPDSVTYLSVANNLHSTGSLVDFNHDPLVVFPCFYPAFLSINLLLSKQLITFIPIVNGLLFGVMIFLSGRIMDRFISMSRLYKCILLACFILSPCLLEVYSMLWSETIYLLLLLFFFIGLKRYLENHMFSSLFFISIIAGIACITRYAGVTVVGTGALLILIDHKARIASRVRNILLFGFISCLPLAINLIRNRLVGGTLTGFRERSNISLRHILENYGLVFRDWLPFFGHASALAICITTAIVIGFGIAVFFVFQAKSFASYESISIIFFLSYTIFIICGACISRFEEINSRLLSPCFIPFLWGATGWVPRWIKRNSSSKKILAFVAGIGLAALFVAGQLSADYENWDGIKDAGIPGYTEDDWAKSAIVQFIQEHKQVFEKNMIYANANDAVYFYTGLPCRFLPHNESPKELSQFNAVPGKWIIWFDAGENADLLDLHYLQENENLKLIQKFEDGSIYFISP